jgi:hypothetical protein
MFDDQESILSQLQDQDQHAAAHAIEQNVAHSATT